MRRITQNRIVIVLLAVVLLAPLFEFLDQGNDLNPDSDFVRALLCVFVAMSLCLLCRKAISFLPRLFRIATIPSVSVLHAANGLIETAAFAPESLLLLGSLRI